VAHRADVQTSSMNCGDLLKVTQLKSLGLQIPKSSWSLLLGTCMSRMWMSYDQDER
jgi:hypothetical protein